MHYDIVAIPSSQVERGRCLVAAVHGDVEMSTGRSLTPPPAYHEIIGETTFIERSPSSDDEDSPAPSYRGQYAWCDNCVFSYPGSMILVNSDIGERHVEALCYSEGDGESASVAGDRLSAAAEEETNSTASNRLRNWWRSCACR